MLFNAYTFIFVFLPATLAVFWLARLWSVGAALWALTLASLAFYAYWDVRFLPLLLGSALVNFALGRAIAAQPWEGRRGLLALGVALNLGALAWFKYATFVSGELAAAGAPIPLLQVTLPIGISFYTFQQIAYLADVRHGLADRYRLRDYLLFVAFFPQLIAGPIVHHREMMPQLIRGPGPRALDMAIGATLFAAGLFKKVVIADSIAPFATPVFAAADAGAAVTMAEAWGAALAYSMQLYFDFSGYSDMALGLARLFGVRLPINFDSPYKATSLIDFWRRWHITLSRFLRDYLYIPLGGNRRGSARRWLNMAVTMVLGGVWHGAGWGFLIWGLIHGLCLGANHAWIAAAPRLGMGWLLRVRWLGRIMTFLMVVVAWVFFRATTLDGALNMLGAMAGAGAPEAALHIEAERWTRGALMIGLAVAVCWLAPNSNEVVLREDPVYGFGVRRAPAWRPSLLWLGPAVATLALAVHQASTISEFLYFQF